MDNKLYDAIFHEFEKELTQCSAEIFLYPLPFTQINRLAMLAATVAERCVAKKRGNNCNTSAQFLEGIKHERDLEGNTGFPGL